MTGFDSRARPATPYLDATDRRPQRLRIGSLNNSLIPGVPIHEDCLQAQHQAETRLRDLGHQVEEASLPQHPELASAFIDVMLTIATVPQAPAEDVLMPFTRTARVMAAEVTGPRLARALATLQQATLLMTLIIPKLMRRLGPPRVYTLGACLLLVGSLLLVALPNGNRSYFASMLPGLAVVGAGLPCCFAPLNAMGVMAVALKDSGIASGILTAFNQTGAALGIASVVTLAQSHAQNLMGQHHTVHSALTVGFRWGYLALAGIALVKVLLSLVIGNDFKKAMAARRSAA